MSLQLEKLDGRHSLNSVFNYRVRFVGNDSISAFVNARIWLTESYGHGLERELVWITTPVYKYDVPQISWAWHNDDSGRYIYLKEELLSHFSLKYLNT